MDLALFALADAPGFLDRLFSDFSYLAPFVVLLLCGVGLPLPEEVTLLGAGVLLHQGEVEFLPIVLVCSAAILLGDLVPFALGRRYGARALEHPWVRRRFHPRRFRKIRARFEEHGSWATFSFRFIAGVRLPGYFVAGTMGLSTLRFVLLDGLGIVLSVPLSIYLGKLFADKLDELKSRMHNLHLILGFIALSAVLILVVRGWRSGRALRAARRRREERLRRGPRAKAGEGVEPPPPASSPEGDGSPS